MCFSFKEKCFKQGAIDSEKIGEVTPRTFVSYTVKEDEVPQPRLFIDSLKNSMPDEETLTRFLQKWYQLALKDLFPQKTKKLCCVGEADSGKTSWFAPYEGIISHDNLASVTRDRHFSASMLSAETECLFVDEWPPDSMTADDAKRVLQGGYIAIPQKHKEAVQFVYKSGIYITCNEIPKFTAIDDAAIEARLEIFQAKSLKEKNPTATNWLRQNCMQRFHWAAAKLHNVPLWTDEDVSLSDSTNGDEGAIFNDFTEQRAAQLIDMTEIESMQFSQDFREAIAAAKNDAHAIDEVVPKEVTDRAITDFEDMEEGWKREESEYFIAHGNINEFRYHKAVYLLTISEGKWQALEPSDEDLARFQRRRRVNWKEADSMYDAWLMIEGTPRASFDLDEFKETFPEWEDQMKQKYGNDRTSKVIDNADMDEDSDNSNEEISSAQRPRRRPRTMVVKRRKRVRLLISDNEEEN